MPTNTELRRPQDAPIDGVTVRRFSKAKSVADRLGICSRTVFRWADAGRITRHKINARVVLFDEAEVTALIDSVHYVSTADCACGHVKYMTVRKDARKGLATMQAHKPPAPHVQRTRRVCAGCNTGGLPAQGATDRRFPLQYLILVTAAGGEMKPPQPVGIASAKMRILTQPRAFEKWPRSGQARFSRKRPMTVSHWS
jgi:hypothetical protein